jgi:hypothetical protein
VILSALKPFGNPLAAFEKRKTADPGNGIMVRVYDAMGTDAEARIEFAGGMTRAWSANLIEERQGDLPVKNGGLSLYVAPFSIETLGFTPGKLGRKMGMKRLGAEAEPVQPVWVRSWEHDAESMPMGYAPVVCSISREVKEEDEGRTLRLKIHAVSDYTDAEVAGVAQLLVPEGWGAEPSAIPFRVAPLGRQTTEVIVRRPDADAAGQIKLRHEYDEQTFQDVFEVGGAFALEMTAENRGDSIAVTLKNLTNETIEAEVSVVTPLETWSKELVGLHALYAISPRTQGVSLAAGATATLCYGVTPLLRRGLMPCDSYWAVAKLMSNGRIRLKRCDDRPPERRMWAGKWFQRYREKQG